MLTCTGVERGLLLVLVLQLFHFSHEVRNLGLFVHLDLGVAHVFVSSLHFGNLNIPQRLKLLDLFLAELGNVMLHALEEAMEETERDEMTQRNIPGLQIFSMSVPELLKSGAIESTQPRVQPKNGMNWNFVSLPSDVADNVTGDLLRIKDVVKCVCHAIAVFRPDFIDHSNETEVYQMSDAETNSFEVDLTCARDFGDRSNAVNKRYQV
mmetsp:Transcript_19631/g.52339  ORF Transcript_19631/g.52339 Transcript_19631/m.52339 type:complete len:209 (+) Transcript_19631:231-857(+)